MTTTLVSRFGAFTPCPPADPNRIAPHHPHKEHTP